MLIKCLGILTLLFITVYFAFEVTMMEKRKLRQAEGFMLFLRHVRAQISCFCTPLTDIFSGFSNDALEECGFLPVAREGNLSCAVDKSKGKIYLEEEEINMLSAFASQLGSSYRNEQLEICDYYIGEFENLFNRVRDEHPKKAKLFRGVVLTGGLMLIVVLI